jgi:putative glutamine amidotransferase
MRAKDEKWFHPIFAKYPDIRVHDARSAKVALEEMNGLLLTGGPDIAQEFLRQPVPDPSILDKDVDPVRDAWEFEAIEDAIARGLPIFAICKGLQVFNVALGGTLKLDIAGHDLPEQKNHDIQPLRSDRGVSHRFDLVNSSHHQAIDRLADGCEIEAWCATDDIVEQMRLRDHPFALAVQYHPERGTIYDALFDDFFSHVKNSNG